MVLAIQTNDAPIIELIEKAERPLSTQEIADQVGFSVNRTYDILMRLAKQEARIKHVIEAQAGGGRVSTWAPHPKKLRRFHYGV